MQWAQHGTYSLEWQGDILVTRLVGEWNDVAARNMHRDARALWQARNGQAWGLLTDAREWGGGTPECFDAWWAFFEAGVAAGMVAATDILPSMLHALIVSELAERARRMVRYRRSQNIDDALAWLAEQDLQIR